MINISFWELVLIFVVALIVLGPQRIPKIAYRLGRWLQYFRNQYYAISAEMKEQMQDEFEKKNPEEKENK